VSWWEPTRAECHRRRLRSTNDATSATAGEDAVVDLVELDLARDLDHDGLGGLHLARDDHYAILVTLLAGDVLPGVSFVQDAYAGGALLTKEAFDKPMIVRPGHDMLFSAGFTSCTADINGDGELNIFDFISFQGVFTSGDMAADCNQDGVLNVLDFVCFQSKFLAGCG
jgi:hypothetical protein